MKARIKITSVKTVKGFIHPNSYYAQDANKYNSSRIIAHKYEPKALFVQGIIDNKPVSFYSPTVVITKTSGFMNYDSMDENNWFELIKGEQTTTTNKSYESEMYPNAATQIKCTITPKIKAGDCINISYCQKGDKINRVRIIN